MPSKKNDAGQRAWNILRLALLWARKGGVFKAVKYLKTLRLHLNHRNNSMIHYGERELSFDETPIFHVKMHRPSTMRFKLPCLNPEVVDFDYDFDGDCDCIGDYEGRKSFLLQNQNGGDEEEDLSYEVCEDMEMVPCEEEGIDVKAEEFIAKFHQQMKLQRQISYLQYNDMLTN